MKNIVTYKTKSIEIESREVKCVRCKNVKMYIDIKNLWFCFV